MTATGNIYKNGWKRRSGVLPFVFLTKEIASIPNDPKWPWTHRVKYNKDRPCMLKWVPQFLNLSPFHCTITYFQYICIFSFPHFSHHMIWILIFLKYFKIWKFQGAFFENCHRGHPETIWLNRIITLQLWFVFNQTFRRIPESPRIKVLKIFSPHVSMFEIWKLNNNNSCENQISKYNR